MHGQNHIKFITLFSCVKYNVTKNTNNKFMGEEMWKYHIKISPNITYVQFGKLAAEELTVHSNSF